MAKGGRREGAGRKPGMPNKITATLRDAILMAAEAAGGETGVVGYLTAQATASPASFLALHGKIPPTQVTGANDGPLEVVQYTDADRAKALAAFLAKMKLKLVPDE